MPCVSAFNQRLHILIISSVGCWSSNLAWPDFFQLLLRWIIIDSCQHQDRSTSENRTYRHTFGGNDENYGVGNCVRGKWQCGEARAYCLHDLPSAFIYLSCGLFPSFLDSVGRVLTDMGRHTAAVPFLMKCKIHSLVKNFYIVLVAYPKNIKDPQLLLAQTSNMALLTLMV